MNRYSSAFDNMILKWAPISTDESETEEEDNYQDE